MEATTTPAAASPIEQAAGAIATRYARASARETEAAIAMLALWTLDAIEAGRLTREDATRVFTNLDVSIGDQHSGPELSEEAHDLLLEGGWFHDHAVGYGPDPDMLRQLALRILRRPER